MDVIYVNFMMFNEKRNKMLKENKFDYTYYLMWLISIAVIIVGIIFSRNGHSLIGHFFSSSGGSICGILIALKLFKYV